MARIDDLLAAADVAKDALGDANEAFDDFKADRVEQRENYVLSVSVPASVAGWNEVCDLFGEPAERPYKVAIYEATRSYDLALVALAEEAQKLTGVVVPSQFALYPALNVWDELPRRWQALAEDTAPLGDRHDAIVDLLAA